MTFIESMKSTQLTAKNEILSGLTVALALVPEAIAFSLIANVSPLVGLYSAFIIGLVTALSGGRPGMISGATGAIAVVIVSLVARHGVEYLFAAVVLMGIIQIGIGLLRLGKFIRLVPHPVMFGFVNGLAIVIFLSQLDQFKITGPAPSAWLSGMPLWIMLGFVLVTMAVIHFLPKFTKAVPASLAAIVGVSAVVIYFDIPTRTVGDIASISGGFPRFHLPAVPLNLETLKIIFPYSLIMALVGLIESLLTLTVIDEMTETRGRGNKECLAQGSANVLTGFFGGMGGCAMIGQSIINVSSGGRKRLSGIVAAVALLLFILVGAPLVEKIPMAALVGLMFMVAIGTFEWASLNIIRKVPAADVFVMVVVATVTVVFHNLAVAVLIGVVISALVFAWENATRIRARKHLGEDGAKHYHIYGPLFFGSIAVFQEKFDVVNDPQEVIIDFKESRVVDHSAIESLNRLTERYAKLGKTVHLRHLSEDCRQLLDNASAIIDVNYWEDPKYKLVVDELA
ncbi:MAG: SulP family inorganic anion transporter [Desulfurivibrionaceae bacterium]|jgi:SulP family sulfate permease|nr:SulP family inorganic anion transporter [Pseudomonadota bacterium]MBU4408393.1 SulP family inorganic anion transporter [Pseudomonadota bacterium]MDP2003320.1 SulP family inorganic anion transporter [Desulfurivibrionaceae bacterium]MDP2757376.1 SulP family inorganic anion transporter [Desulfurivibrionaceae bacterium]PKN21860.1 MAG: sodium-independent anion transporter [Deltaproteobacteria bacterium HGW-Deltaproteobacteria-3]